MESMSCNAWHELGLCSCIQTVCPSLLHRHNPRTLGLHPTDAAVLDTVAVHGTILPMAAAAGCSSGDLLVEEVHTSNITGVPIACPNGAKCNDPYFNRYVVQIIPDQTHQQNTTTTTSNTENSIVNKANSMSLALG